MAEEIGFRIRVQGAAEQLAAMEKLKIELNGLAVEKKKLNDESKKLTKQFQEGTITVTEYDESIAALSAEQVENGLITKQTTFEYSENEKALISNEKAVKAETGSLAQLRIQLAQSKKEWTNLSAEERNNEKVGGELLKTQQALDEEVRGLEKQIGVTSRNVGNYGEAVSAATPLMGAFGGKINQVQQTLGQVKELFAKVTASTKANAIATKANAASQTALGTATKGTAGSFNLASKAAKIFKFALAATGIGAIVVILGSLITAILSTQRGADAMTRVLGPLKEIFATIFGLIQKVGLKVFDQLKAAINDPGQALKDLGNAIKQNIINRFTAAVNLVKLQGRAMVVSFKALGLGIKKALAGVPLIGAGIDVEQVNKDLEEVKNEAIQVGKEIKDNLIQAGTGLDPTQIEALVQAGKDFSEEMRIAAERGAEIAELTIEIEENEIGLNRAKEKGNRLFEEQKKIAEDTLLSDAERIKAAQEAQRILKETEKIQIDQLDRRIKLAKLETEANDTDRETLKEIQDLEAEKEALVAQSITKSIELRNKENAIIKTRIAAVKKAQDDELKRLQKLEDERAKIADKDTERALQKELEILDIKANTLQMERELEAASVDETDRMRLDKEIELQKKLTDLKIQGAEKQAGALEVKEGELTEELKKLREESGGKETLEILKTQDALNQAKAAKEKILNEDVALIRQEDRSSEAIKEAEFKAETDKKEAEAELERLKEKEELKKAIVDASFQAGEIVADGILNRQKARIDEEKERSVSALEAKKQAGVISQAEFEKARLDIDKKAFDKQKKADTARAVINGSVAIGKTFATLGFTPAAAIAVGLGALKTAAEIATIQGQSFAVGGFTGSGQGAPDSSGHKVAGVVHANEYVVPKKVLDSPQGAAMVGNLERMRLQTPTTNVSRGFINGGFTSEPESIDMQAFEKSVARSVTASIKSIPVVNDPTQTAGVNRDVNNIQNEVNF